jgi:hypothetical protein
LLLVYVQAAAFGAAGGTRMALVDCIYSSSLRPHTVVAEGLIQ